MNAAPAAGTFQLQGRTCHTQDSLRSTSGTIRNIIIVMITNDDDGDDDDDDDDDDDENGAEVSDTAGAGDGSEAMQ